jgi:hypothetical protein
VKHQVKHFLYSAGWKKFEAVWDFMIRTRQLRRVTPLLEGMLSRVTRGNEANRVDSRDDAVRAQARG